MNYARRIAVLLALTLLSALPLVANATCQFENTRDRAASVSISFASSVIVIDPNAAVGSVLATTGQFTPSPIQDMTCSGKTTIGVNNLISTQPGGSTTIYPTGVPGIGYRITHPDTSDYLLPYGFDSYQATSSNQEVEFSVTSGIELVKTGTIANGSTVPAGLLANWQYGSTVVENFTLSRSVTLTYPACTVNSKAVNVVLPTISNTAFKAVGNTAGATPFNISLTCSAGSTLLVEFDTANQSSVASVIANATGNGRAKNVGVQLTDQNFAPITFGTPAVVGTTPNGPYNLTYYARYYQTATATPTAGTVSATATFTLTYQ